jgi:hypothetical protein
MRAVVGIVRARRNQLDGVRAEDRQAAALFQSIRMQLSVGRYKAIATERGANLDTIDLPLNNRGWLTARTSRRSGRRPASRSG